MIQPSRRRTWHSALAVGVALAALAACATDDDRLDSSPTPPATRVDTTPTAEEPMRTGPLADGDWVALTADGTEVRDAPGEAATVVGMVRTPAVGLVIGDPVVAEGTTWVPVAGPELPYGPGCVSAGPMGVFDASCPLWRGWIAADSPMGDPSLVRTELDCPDDEPTTANELLAIPLGIGVACFGGQTLTVQARLAPETAGSGCPSGHGVVPAWMHSCAELFFPSRTGEGFQGLLGMLHPSVATCESWSDSTCPIAPLIGELVDVHGSLDHPEAALCDESTPGVDLRFLDEVFIEYSCRTRFVITAIGPAR